MARFTQIHAFCGLLLLLQISGCTAKLTPQKTPPSGETWTTRGFAAFRAGTFGNGGQNLYVSKAGVLQRIYQYDLDGNGFFDLVFCNSQNDNESAPSFLYEDVLGDLRRSELPGHGTMTALAADLTANGVDDIILGMKYDAVTYDLNASIYYGEKGSPYSNRRMNYLPAPLCESVTSGRFDQGERPSIVFVAGRKVRIFPAGENGFNPRDFQELPDEARQVAAGDIDHDGFDDLAVLNAAGETRIYYGGDHGLQLDRFDRLPFQSPALSELERELQQEVKYGRREEPYPLLQMIRINGQFHVSAVNRRELRLFRMDQRGVFTEAWTLPVKDAYALAAGDLDGDGFPDLAVAARTPHGERETSYLYWGGKDGFSSDNYSSLETFRACDAAIADLDGDGRNELVICQSHTPDSYSTESLVFQNLKPVATPIKATLRLPTDDARRVQVVHGQSSNPSLLFANNRSRSLVGNDFCTVYLGGEDGFRADRFANFAAWGAVDSLSADIDDDGNSDLVLANCSEDSPWLDPGSWIHLNPFQEKSAARIELPTKGAHGVVTGDLNRDGFLDFIFSSWSRPELTVFFGGPDGFDPKNGESIPIRYRGKTLSTPRWICLADLNLDGWPDLVVPLILENSSFILWGGEKGYSFDRAQELLVYRGVVAKVADLDRDGYPELIFGGYINTPMYGKSPLPEPHSSFIHIFWNGPDGFRQEKRTLLRSDAADGLAIADFNGDGALDIFAGSYHNGKERDIDSFIYWNRNGVFGDNDCLRLRTHSASSGVAADFNLDGRVDLAVANHKVYGDHKGFSTVWWNGPDGFHEKAVTQLPTWGPHGTTTADPGNQLTRGPEEYYTSIAYQLTKEATGYRLEWDGTIPPQSSVRGRLRQADSAVALATAPYGKWLSAGELQDGQMTRGIWVQYQLEIAAINGLRSPRLTEVRVCFENNNSITGGQ